MLEDKKFWKTTVLQEKDFLRKTQIKFRSVPGIGKTFHLQVCFLDQTLWLCLCLLLTRHIQLFFVKSGFPRQCMMSCFPCCLSSDKTSRSSLRNNAKRDLHSPRSWTSFVTNISFKSDGSRRRYIAEEIKKHGKGNISAEVIPFKELSLATDSFKPENLIGEGGFGRVYKGKIEKTGQVIAVKTLDRNGFQGNREFLVEVLMLSLLHHPHLVNLVGYCADGQQRVLVYEYMVNGSLEDHLFGTRLDATPLEWTARMKIALGAAKGLEYLHEIANPPVIYRDFKASNVLLDENFNPKLSDFGLAKLGPTGDKVYVSTRVMGTYGYCAPEYASTGQLTPKSDVYSFGVVLLEMITGRRVIDTSKPTEEQNLVIWATPLFKDRKKFTQMADPLLEGKFPMKGLHQALAVAAMCLQEEAATRPLMSDVVTALEYLALNKDDEDEAIAASQLNSGASDISSDENNVNTSKPPD